MSKTATENTLSKVLRILNVKEVDDAPAELMDQLHKNPKELFVKFGNEFTDLSRDYFHEYFQEEHADRKNNKQDFTPTCIGGLLSKIMQTNGIVYEPTAGTGGMIIQNWNKHRINYTPWNLDNMKQFYVAEELSKRTIPFLIFNLAIRGINANVIHCNSLTRECYEIWCLENLEIGYGYSKIHKVPKNETAEKIFNVKFIE